MLAIKEVSNISRLSVLSLGVWRLFLKLLSILELLDSCLFFSKRALVLIGIGLSFNLNFLFVWLEEVLLFTSRVFRLIAFKSNFKCFWLGIMYDSLLEFGNLGL